MNSWSEFAYNVLHIFYNILKSKVLRNLQFICWYECNAFILFMRCAYVCRIYAYTFANICLSMSVQSFILRITRIQVMKIGIEQTPLWDNLLNERYI